MTTTLYRNGTVHSPADPFATAMLVEGDRVAWVGAEGAVAGRPDDLGDDVDQVVDLDGALVTPAFVDAHVHRTESGRAHDGVDLDGVSSLAEALSLVRARVRERPGEPVIGFGWDETTWPDRRAPSRIASADGYDEAGVLRRDAHHRARRIARAGVSAERRAELRRNVLTDLAGVGFAAVHEIGAPHSCGLGRPGGGDRAGRRAGAACGRSPAATWCTTDWAET